MIDVAIGTQLCYHQPVMISWDIVVGLMLLSFVLPFFCLHMKVQQLRRRNHVHEAELFHLRAIVREMEDLQEKEKSLFLEALGIPFILVRPSGRLVLANSAAGRLLGIDPKCRMNLLRMLPESPVKEIITASVKAEKPNSTDFSMPIRGVEHFFHASAMPLGNADRHIGIVFNDVTEEQRALIIRKEFVANASHELRTPLTIICGYLETLLESPEVAEDKKQRTRSLELINKHANRIVRLVEDMLNISRLESSRQDYLKQEEICFSDLVADVRLQLERMIARQQTTLRVHSDPDPFFLKGDRFYWTQIMSNLMENALKNNPAPGLVLEVTAKRDATGTSTIEVRDNGVGIPADALPYIFNRFYRANTSESIKGTGLGLSIVKHAVEAHGGSILAHSAPGVETVFLITLPPEERGGNGQEASAPAARHA